MTFELVAEKSRCPGSRFSLHWIKTIEECASGCKSETSMFIYGRSDTANCDHRGCYCSCEQTVTDGQCTRGPTDDNYYNLYRIVLGTDILFIIRILITTVI